MERIQKILSHAGIASRRASERLMLEGRVTVNGTTVRELGTKADPSQDDIRVDGRRIKLPERYRYVLLNKPRGYVTTRSDPQKRPTVIDLVGIREYIYPVGRLDFDSEGLLLLTNDGDLAARLTHPRHGVERVYQARVLGVPDDHDLARLRRGIVIDGRRTEPAAVQVLGPHSRSSVRPLSPSTLRRAQGRPEHGRGARASGSSRPATLREPQGRPEPSRGTTSSGRPEPVEGRAASRDGKLRVSQVGGRHAHGAAAARLERRPSRAAQGNATLQITIREGRNRQVRKMLDAIGHPVDHLERVAIGPIRDGYLKPGQWRELTPDEVKKLRASAQTTLPRPADRPVHKTGKSKSALRN